jgi:hypothetical protein
MAFDDDDVLAKAAAISTRDRIPPHKKVLEAHSTTHQSRSNLVRFCIIIIKSLRFRTQK